MADRGFVRSIFRTRRSPVAKISQVLDALPNCSGNQLTTGSFGWSHACRGQVIFAKVMNPRLERRHLNGLARPDWLTTR
jgi:hypothetical protein